MKLNFIHIVKAFYMNQTFCQILQRTTTFIQLFCLSICQFVNQYWGIAFKFSKFMLVMFFWMRSLKRSCCSLQVYTCGKAALLLTFTFTAYSRARDIIRNQFTSKHFAIIQGLTDLLCSFVNYILAAFRLLYFYSNPGSYDKGMTETCELFTTVIWLQKI